MAKTCPKCRAELWDDGTCLLCAWRRVPAQPTRPSGDEPGAQPSDWRRPPGQPARPSVEQPAAQRSWPGDWRRWVTGTIACALGLLSLGALVLVADAASCDPNTEWCLIGPGDVFVLLVLPLWVMAAPFALATVLPFGRLWGMTVALGAAMLAGAVAFAAATVVVYSA